MHIDDGIALAVTQAATLEVWKSGPKFETFGGNNYKWRRQAAVRIKQTELLEFYYSDKEWRN